MKVLVTGGAGFIGSNVVAKLVAKGHEVAVLDDLSSGYRRNLDPFPLVRFIEGDVRDEKLVAKAIDGACLVFHLAASVGNTRSIENPVCDASVNVLGTLNILNAAREAEIRRVVFSSSAGIFGELKTLPIAEDHPQDPDSPYGVSKLAAEKLCLVYNKLYGTKNVCLRYFNVYGPNQRYDAYGNVIPIFARHIMFREPITVFGDGEQTRDFVSVHDVVNANLGAGLDERAQGVFNIGSGGRISINRLAELMLRIGGRVAVEHGPPRRGDVRDSLADITSARSAFGFSPRIPMEQGLEEYMNWLKHDPQSDSQHGRVS
jgi:UDP-glucose 4-epimerase